MRDQAFVVSGFRQKRRWGFARSGSSLAPIHCRARCCQPGGEDVALVAVDVELVLDLRQTISSSTSRGLSARPCGRTHPSDGRVVAERGGRRSSAVPHRSSPPGAARTFSSGARCGFANLSTSGMVIANCWANSLRPPPERTLLWQTVARSTLRDLGSDWSARKPTIQDDQTH